MSQCNWVEMEGRGETDVTMLLEVAFYVDKQTTLHTPQPCYIIALPLQHLTCSLDISWYVFRKYLKTLLFKCL